MKKLIFCSLMLYFFQPTCAAANLTYGETKVILSEAFGDQRKFYVHLPESYQTDKKKKYPVLYLLHGQWDLLSAVAVFDTISNDIPEFIIIGVQSKGLELRPVVKTGNSINTSGKKFKSFLVQELIPHIEQTYRVAEFSILSGHSNSGRFVLNTLLDDPRTFSAYFAFSPSLDDNYINQRVSQNVRAFTDNNSTLFMTLANEGEHMQTPYDELIALFDKPQSTSTQFFHKEFPAQSHASTKIVSLLFSMKVLFDGWEPTREVQWEGLTGFQRHYTKLSNKYGFEIAIPLYYMLTMTYHFSASPDDENHQKATDLINFALSRDQNSADDFADLAGVLINQGHPKAAQRITALICKNVTNYRLCDTK